MESVSQQAGGDSPGTALSAQATAPPGSPRSAGPRTTATLLAPKACTWPGRRTAGTVSACEMNTHLETPDLAGAAVLSLSPGGSPALTSRFTPVFPCGGELLIIPSIQMRKLRHRAVKLPARRGRAGARRASGM